MTLEVSQAVGRGQPITILDITFAVAAVGIVVAYRREYSVDWRAGDKMRDKLGDPEGLADGLLVLQPALAGSIWSCQRYDEAGGGQVLALLGAGQL